MKDYIEKLREFDNKIAFIWMDEIYTYRWLVENIEKLSNYINNYYSDNKIFAIHCKDYSPLAIALFLALYQNGKGIVLYCNLDRRKTENRNRIAGIDVNIYVEDENIIYGLVCNNKPDLIKQILDRGAAALVLFSSGTTDEPKAMAYDLDRLIGSYINKKNRNLAFLIFLLFDHIGGLNTLFNALSMGAKIVVPQKREPDLVCQLIEQYEVNILPTSPTFLQLLLLSGSHKKYNLNSLRMITYGSEAMPKALLERLQQELPRVKFWQTFGTSEIGILETVSQTDGLFFKITDPSVEWKIIDGELWIKAQRAIEGYLNQANPFINGWFATGDLVEVDDKGQIRIIGRKTDLINVGGMKVMPQEVENVILQLPEIADVIVYGEPNVLMGQIVTAKIILKTKILDQQEIGLRVRKYCASKLEKYKIPIKVIIVDNLNYDQRFKRKRGLDN